jgi:hypothetical protein
MENTQPDKKDEDYDLIHKILMVIFWITELTNFPELKENGYITKLKSRRLCLTIGALIYATFIALIVIYNIRYRLIK